jgi:hypothetical protein
LKLLSSDKAVSLIFEAPPDRSDKILNQQNTPFVHD